MGHKDAPFSRCIQRMFLRTSHALGVMMTATGIFFLKDCQKTVKLKNWKRPLWNSWSYVTQTQLYIFQQRSGIKIWWRYEYFSALSHVLQCLALQKSGQISSNASVYKTRRLFNVHWVLYRRAPVVRIEQDVLFFLTLIQINHGLCWHYPALLLQHTQNLHTHTGFKTFSYTHYFKKIQRNS